MAAILITVKKQTVFGTDNWLRRSNFKPHFDVDEEYSLSKGLPAHR